MSDETDQAHFEHDCERCIFLGSWTGAPYGAEGNDKCRRFDLYVCKNKRSPNLDSWIARWGSEGSEYFSSHPPAAFAQPYRPPAWELEIARRIAERT